MNLRKVIDKLNTEFKELEWSICPNLKLGILACNSFFAIAKTQKQSPQILASQYQIRIQNFLDKEGILLETRVAGAYLNLDFKPEFVLDFFTKETEVFKLQKLSQTILMDYFAPNVGKNAHIGNIRSANLGESMRRILSEKYTKVISNNHLGDWGVQFSLLIWGMQNFVKLQLEFTPPNFDKNNTSELIDKFYKIYVAVNALMEVESEIKEKSREILLELEQEMSNYQSNLANSESLLSLWKRIIIISQKQYLDVESFLNLNQNPLFLKTDKLIEDGVSKSIQSKNLDWGLNQFHQNSQFDLVLGESFYVSFFEEIKHLVDQGVFQTEGKSVFVDLEQDNLGRCYLVSSMGYTTYAFRDVAARFVWSGVLESNLMITFADNRQTHSLAQSFKIVEKIVQSGVYENRNFGWLTKEQTTKALNVLINKSSIQHVSFGFMSLPEGVMSTRKGRILAFKDIKTDLETKAREVIIQKNATEPTDTLVRKIAVATLKWIDLYRDREVDIIFDSQKALQFEGNTGVYQLYTIARITSIFEKNQFVDNQIQPEKLNPEEFLILKQIALLPLVLESICQNYKPHLLTNFLFELATSFNSWYAKYSTLAETDLERKNTLLHFCNLIKNTLIYGLEMLGIEPVEKI